VISAASKEILLNGAVSGALAVLTSRPGDGRKGYKKGRATGVIMGVAGTLVLFGVLRYVALNTQIGQKVVRAVQREREIYREFRAEWLREARLREVLLQEETEAA